MILAGPGRGLALILHDIERLREVAVGAPFALDRLRFADYELPARAPRSVG